MTEFMSRFHFEIQESGIEDVTWKDIKSQIFEEEWKKLWNSIHPQPDQGFSLSSPAVYKLMGIFLSRMLSSPKKTENSDGANSENVTWKDVKYQILTSHIAFLLVMHLGMSLSFPNLLLDEFDKNIISWFASIIGLSVPVGYFLCGPLMDKFGRKTTNLIATFLCLLSWIFIYIIPPDQIMLLYCARFLAGLSGGLSMTIVVYVSEISHRKYRPALLGSIAIHFSAGVLLTTILQSFLAWKEAALFNAIFFIIVFLLIAFCTVESPTWLVFYRNDWAEAEISLAWLISSEKAFAEEWDSLHQMALSEKKERQTSQTKAPRYKAMFLVLMLLILQSCSGIFVVMFYTISIFSMISPRIGSLAKNETFILFGVVLLTGSIINSFLSLRVGRKPLLIISGVGVQLSYLVVVAASATTERRQSLNLPDIYEWIIVSIFLSSIFFATIGIMSIPLKLTVELLPYAACSMANAMITTWAALLVFIFAKIFPLFAEAANIWCVILFSAIASTLISKVTFFLVPETFGKTFDEIDKYFR